MRNALGQIADINRTNMVKMHIVHMLMYTFIHSYTIICLPGKLSQSLTETHIQKNKTLFQIQFAVLLSAFSFICPSNLSTPFLRTQLPYQENDIPAPIKVIVKPKIKQSWLQQNPFFKLHFILSLRPVAQEKKTFEGLKCSETKK